LPGKVDQAYSNHMRLMAARSESTAELMKMGAMLWHMRESKEYEDLGYATFEDYVADCTGLKRKSAFGLIALYEMFGIKLCKENLDLTGIDVDRLEMIRPVITADTAHAWVERARTLGLQDLRAIIDEFRGRRVDRARRNGKFPVENERLAQLHAQVIDEIWLDETGLIVVTDTGLRLRLWAAIGVGETVDESKPVLMFQVSNWGRRSG